MEKETSRAYIASHIKLRSEIYNNWETFNENLKKGPEYMKNYLYSLWTNISEKDVTEGVKIVDLDRQVSPEDFDITSNVIGNDIRIFYFIFPDSKVKMAEAKCIALALTPNMPRYFTMEILSAGDIEEKYIIGEWIIKDKHFEHINYGAMEKTTVAAFAYRVQTLLLGNSNLEIISGINKKTVDLLNNDSNIKDVFSVCIGKVYNLMDKFNESIGEVKEWSTDLNTGVLKINDHEYNVNYIGSTAPSQDQFWYSAEIEKQIPDQFVDMTIKTRKVFEALSLEELTVPKQVVDKDKTHFIISAIYSAFAPTNNVLYLAGKDPQISMFVKDLDDNFYSNIDAARFSRLAMEIISNYEVNHKLMIKAFLIENNCHFIEEASNIVGLFPSNSKLTFKFDENDRLTNIDGNL